MERGLCGGLAILDRRFPSDFNAGEQIRLGPDGGKEAGRLEPVLAKDLLIRVEGHCRATSVGGRTHFLHRPQGDAAREALLVQLFVLGDLHNHAVGQCVDNRGAHTVQTAGGLIGLPAEFATRVQGAKDHLERGFVRELGVRIDRNAAAVVADGDSVIGMQLNLDPVGVARDSLVHRVIKDLGHKVVQRAFIRAADIHAGAQANRLKPL